MLMRFWTGAFLVGLCIFFFLQTVVLASETCPKKGSPEATAIQYQLYAAYQTGYDGYQTPCQHQCLDHKDCQKNCREKQALRLLQSKLQELVARKGYSRCPSMSVGCVEQCKDQGLPCQAACSNDKSFALGISKASSIH